jgi:hypothetical protein
MRAGVRAAAVAAVVIGMLFTASAASAADEPLHTISVLAEGSAQSPPDIAFLNAGVEAEAPTARAALNQVNGQIEQVLAALRAFGIAAEDILTSGLNVYRMNPPSERGESGPGRAISYNASNSVNITVRDLTRVGALLDVLTEAGVNNLGGIQFAIRDEDALRRTAIAEAVRDARPLAESAARAAGLNVGEVLAIAQVGDFGGPVAVSQRGGLGAGPVEGGTLTTRLQVRVTFALVR